MADKAKQESGSSSDKVEGKDSQKDNSTKDVAVQGNTDKDLRSSDSVDPVAEDDISDDEVSAIGKGLFGGSTKVTKNFARAFKGYDSGTTSPQVSELWKFNDDSFRKVGRF